jgi:hypothetical protein
MIETICISAILLAIVLLVLAALVRLVQSMEACLLWAAEPDLEFKATHILAVTPGTKMEVMVVEGHVIYQSPFTNDITDLGLVEDFPEILFPLEAK